MNMENNPGKRLDFEIQKAQAEGNKGNEAAARAEKAMHYLTQGEFQKMAFEMGKIGELAAEDGQYLQLAHTYYAQGQSLVYKHNHLDKAQELLEKAANLYRQVEDKEGEIKSRKSLSNIFLLEGNHVKADQQLDYALGRISFAKNPSDAVELLRLKSAVQMLTFLFVPAAKNLNVALQLAEEHALEKEKVEIQLQQNELKQMQNGRVSAKNLEALIESAQEVGDWTLVANAKLQRMQMLVDQKKFNEAVELGEELQNEIARSVDLMKTARFMMVTQLVVYAYKRLDNKLGVLDSYLKCRVYLAKLVSAESAEIIDTILNRLAEEWGEAEMQKVVAQWQQANSQQS